jgi:hypothetical protein
MNFLFAQIPRFPVKTASSSPPLIRVRNSRLACNSTGTKVLCCFFFGKENLHFRKKKKRKGFLNCCFYIGFRGGRIYSCTIKECFMAQCRLIAAACACLLPGAAWAQSSYIAPDGRNRYPGVTIFCAHGNGVQPCSFGGGGSSGSVTITLGGSPVSTSNKLPVSDPLLDALIGGGALSVGGTVSLSGTPTVQFGSGTSIALSTGGSLVSAVNPLAMRDAALEALISGGALSVGGTVSISGTPSVTLGAGSAAIGTVSVSNLPATQAVSAVSLPLPAGAATAALQGAPLAPVAPGTGTATNSVLIGCLANTTLPGFAAGQQGAVPCDTSGRPYVVTVPSATNVPVYLQAVSSGGATVYRAINTASSTMAANIKASSGMLYGYEACNSGASAVYFRVFGLATAPVAGTSVPSITKIVPASGCTSFTGLVGVTVPNGIGVDVTSGSMADSDSSSISSANQVAVEVYYK